MVQIPAQTTPKCGTRPIRYVALHFRDRSGEVTEMRAEITVLTC